MPDNNKLTSELKNPFSMTQEQINEIQKGIVDPLDITGVGGGSGDSQALPERYREVGAKNNWSPFAPPKDMERQAYLSQSGGEVFENAVRGFGNQFGAGILKAIGSWDLTGTYDMAIGNKEKQYTNWLNDSADKLLDYNNEARPIFQEGGLWNSSYWANQFQSLGLSTGIIAESLGEQALMAYMTGGTGNAASLSMKARLLRSMGSQFAFGSLKGVQEAYINGLETQSNVYQKYIDLGFDEETAQQKSSEAATLAYRAEITPLMIINGLQYAATFGAARGLARNPGVATGYSSAVESVIDRALPSVTNKFAKGAIQTGTNMIAESSEEGIQNVIQQYAENETMNPNQEFNPFNRELLDNMIGGALGGGVFQVGGSLLKSFTKNTSANQLDYLHDRFLNEAPLRFSNSYNDKANKEQVLMNSIKEYDANPNSSNKTNLEKAKFEYDKSQSNSQVQSTLDALYLDYMSDKTTAFESHIEQMQGILDAVNSNDTKALTEFGLLNEQGTERFPGSFDMVKNTFNKNITDAQDIKKILENNLTNITSDFESAWAITANQFSSKESLDAINTIYNEAETNLTSNIQYNQLSDSAKRRFQLEREINVLQNMGDLSNRNQDRLVSLREDLENASEYTNTEKALLDTIPSESLLGSYMEAYLHNEQVDDNNKQLLKLTNKQYIRDQISERRNEIRKEKASQATKETVEDIREQIVEETGDFTPEDNGAVESAAIANNVEPREQAKQRLEGSLFTAEELAMLKATEAITPEVTATPEFNESLNLQPHVYESKNDSHNRAVEKYAQSIQGLDNNFRNQGLTPLTPKEIFNIIANVTGRDVAHDNFNLFKEGYRRSGVPFSEQELDNIYNDMYGIVNSLLGATPIPLETVTPIVESSNTNMNEEKQAAELISHLPLEEKEVPYTGPKVAEATLKLAFKGVDFTIGYNELGNEIKIDNPELLRDGLYDIDTIVDPNQLLVGQTMLAEMDLNYVHPNGYEPGSREWLSDVPVMGIYNGKAIGPIVHSVNWWNTNNVADFSYNPNLSEYERQEKQRQVIEEARDFHFNVRQAIYNNNGQGKLTITEKSTGFESNANGELFNVGGTVPNATVGFINYDKQTGNPLIVIGDNKVFEGNILNDFFYNDEQGVRKSIGAGTTVMVKQAGVNKEGEPTYVVYPVIDNYNQESLQNLRSSLGKIYDAVDAVNQKRTVKGITPEMGNKILDEVARITKVGKTKLLEVSGNAHIGLDNINSLYPERMRQDRNLLRMGYSNKGVGKEVPIVNLDNSVTSRPYDEVLKEQLYTQHKFYEINTPKGKDYILYPQPRIEYSLEGVDTNSSTVEFIPNEDKETVVIETPIEEIEIAEEQVIEPIEDITNITNSQVALVKQEFFNMALKDIFNYMSNNPKETLTNVKVKSLIVNSFDNHLDNKDFPDGRLFRDVYPSEYNYLKSNKDNLLGLGEYSDDYTSIIKSVGDFINQELNDIIDEEGFNEKTNDRAAFEVNVKTTLGLKAKLLLAGRAVVPASKRVREDFGGFQEYYKIDDVYDALQQILANNNNDIDSAVNKIDNWIKLNPGEFGFLEGIKKVLVSGNTPTDIKKQLLYRLNQTKNQMFFGLYSKVKGGWKLQSYNANSRDPKITVNNYFTTNLKTNSPLVNYTKKGFTLNEDVANKLYSQFQEWKNKNSLDSVSAVELGNWLSNFGIDANPTTIEKYKIANNSAFSSNGSLHGRLAQNLKDFLAKQKERQAVNPEFVFSSDDAENIEFKGNSILQYETAKFLKEFINLEVANTFHPLKSMYIAGKTINTYSQPNFASLQVDKLKDNFDDNFRKELLETPFAKNSIVLDLLQTNKRVRETLAISYVSLNPLKQRRQKVYNDDSIVSMYAGDREASMLSHFFTSEAEYGNIGKFKYRGVKMSSPALSDSSQMFLLHVPAMNLTKGNFIVDEQGEFTLTEDVLEMVYSQLVKPDIDRIEAFLKANTTTNTVGKDLSSQLITALPELNTLGTGDSFLLEDIHKAVLANESLDEVLAKYRPLIHSYLESYIIDGAKAKFDLSDGIAKGDWVRFNFYRKDPKSGKFGVGILDTNYLKERNGVSLEENLKIASLDYFINYMVSQAQWQMLFAGDYNNYFKENNGVFEDKSNGLPNVFKIKNLKLEEGEDVKVKLQEKYNSFERKAKVDLSKRLKEQISPGNRLADSHNKRESNTNYVQLMISDVERPSNTLDAIVKLWYNPTAQDLQDIETLQTQLTALDRAEEQGRFSDVERLTKETTSLRKDLQKRFPEVADYMNITGTDAQEYTTWREHLNILYNQGNINKQDYETIKAKLKEQSKEGVNKNNKLTKEEKKVVFQPIKPLHTGMYFSDINGFKDQRFVYVKTSSFPLLPETTLNSVLDGVRANMEKLERTLEKPVRASYQTGNKVGAIKNTIGFNRLSNPEIDAKELISSSMILDRANFSIQQDKPFKTDKNIKAHKRDEVNRGTQFEDIILGNNINHIEEKVFPNLFDADLLSDIEIEVVDGNVSGQDLYKIYNHIYEREQGILLRQLYNSLGLDSNGEWEDSISSLESIRDLLKKQLNNQQDKEILELVYIVPTTDTNGRQVNEYLTESQLDSFNSERKSQGLEEVRPTRAEFNLPLWITPNSQKFESVLNATVGNKLIRLKMPGFSSPVASEQGFKYMEEQDYTKGSVIYTEAYNPVKGLQATHFEDGSLKYAQVLVASKFRDANGQLAELPTRVVNGKRLLDTERIDKDLLSMFSFRIPTSAHQSGAIIEIVGFLPHEQGDLMIVPKDHTTQIGEDYDIDTRYVYGFNTYQNRDGDIRKVDGVYVNEMIENVTKKTDSDQGLNTFYRDTLNNFLVFSEDVELQNLFDDETISIERKKNITIDKLRQLALENNITSLFKSVYSTTNPEVQKSISATLSTQFAEDTASMIDDKISTGINYSIYDDRHQSRVMMLGASGKMGIGVHSNWVVLNSLFQQVPMEDKPQLIGGTTEEGDPIPLSMVFGDFVTDGKLGLVRPIGPSTVSITTANMINQNSSTDNQKLQIMGRRNENKYTINVFALMTNLGIIDDKLSNGQMLGYPDLFISQPIIRRYAELKAKYDSITSEYNSDTESEIEAALISEYATGIQWAVQEDETGEEVEMVGFMDRALYDRVSKNLTAQTLYDNLVQGEGAYLNENQWAVYEKFKELDIQGKEVAKLQQMLNIEGQGLGISYFDVIMKANNLLADYKIINADKMLGNLTQTDSKEERANLEKEGYVYLTSFENTDFLVQPTTPQNRKLINSTATAYNLWKNIFPFEDTAISEQIDRLLDISEVKPDTRRGQELRYDTLRGIQDFFYSYKSPLGSIFTESVDEERRRLFMNDGDNVPLANYLFLLKNKRNPIFQESFFRDLEFQIGFEGEESIIEYNLSEKSNFNKNEAYKILEELAVDERNIEEGVDYTYSNLVRDLTKYSLLSNQEKGAIGFRQYIPVSVLQRFGVIDSLRMHTNVGAVESHSKLLNGLFSNLKKDFLVLEGSNFTIKASSQTRFENNVIQINGKYGKDTVRFKYDFLDLDTIQGTLELQDSMSVMNKSVFTKQFIQHNPQYAKTINLAEEESEWNKELEDGNLIRLKSKTGMDKEFIKVRDSENSLWILFESQGMGVYNRIETLGIFGVNEYSPFDYNKTSMFEENKFGKGKKIESQLTVVPVQNKTNMTARKQIEESSVTQLIQSIADNNDSKFKDIASLLLPFVEDKKINIMDLSRVRANGGYVEDVRNLKGTILHPELGEMNRGEIYLDSNLVDNGKSEDIRYALVEEVLHSITSEEVSRYVNSKETAFDEEGRLKVVWNNGIDDSNAPIYITRLLSVYQQAGKHAIGKLSGASRNLKISQINESASVDGTINRLLNLKEFIVGITTDEIFRNEMAQVSYNGKSILSRFADVIRGILNKILGDKGLNNSISENGFNAVMDLLEMKGKLPPTITAPSALNTGSIMDLLNSKGINGSDSIVPDVNLQPSLQTSEIIDVLLSNKMITKINC